MDEQNRVINCRKCGKVNEFEAPVSRPLPGTLYTEFGFTCVKCGKWEHLYFTSRILMDKARALTKLRPGSPKYNRAFTKFRRKFDNLQRELRGYNGALPNTNVVVAR